MGSMVMCLVITACLVASVQGQGRACPPQNLHVITRNALIKSTYIPAAHKCLHTGECGNDVFATEKSKLKGIYIETVDCFNFVCV